MIQPKDYDATLARIAGNIAGSIWVHWQGTPNEEYVARTAVELALVIVKRYKELVVPPVKNTP